MQQEVSKIEKISNEDFIENKIFEEADVYEQESEDPFFKFQSRGSYQHVQIVRKFVERRRCFHYDEQGYIYVHRPYKAEGKRFVDPSLAKPFMKPRTFVHNVDNSRKVLKSKMLVRNDVSGNSQCHGSDSPSIKKRRRKNQLQKLLFQSDPSKKLGNDAGSFKRSNNSELGNPSSVSENLLQEVSGSKGQSRRTIDNT
ncbi:hypothetical protein L1987_15161 [Smallanthus sonchifolius]|uniref:Uncharacterized protein n=1 Tax=Smallanthus sonchifolius TaxID=185202 RepID=A0ACB9J5V4_9ASTR|nr:hypothetical protein L1987_15161 [Smallanthus sonchifolius]